MDKSIGLFFGTFDPLHNGHVSIAKYFLTKLNLDKIWLVITPLSPFKKANKVSNYYKRFKIIYPFGTELYKEGNMDIGGFNFTKLITFFTKRWIFRII